MMRDTVERNICLPVVVSGLCFSATVIPSHRVLKRCCTIVTLLILTILPVYHLEYAHYLIIVKV